MRTEQSNTPLDERLAKRIETLRRERGLTLDEVADRSGISRATISRIERGETSPTAHVLGRLCPIFDTTMSQLLLDTEANAPSLLPLRDAMTWTDPETGFRRTSLSPPAPGYAVEVVFAELPPGAAIAYEHPLTGNPEHHIVMLSGTLAMTVEGRRHVLAPYDRLRFILSGPSAFENPGDQLATYLVIIRKPS